jgi:demethylspheroidene O-methyltransferase
MQLSRKVKFITFRNRLIANARFRSFLARFWFTRGFARRRVSAMFDINAGFVYSQIASAIVTLDLLPMLAAGPASTSQVARNCSLSLAAADRLLKAAVALQFAEAVGPDAFMLGERGAVLNADPGIAAMIAHHAHLYADLADPVALLRNGPGGGALQRYWSYAGHDDPAATSEGQTAPYSALMASSQTAFAALVRQSYDFSRHRRMLDVGGGEGIFAASVKVQWPQIDVAVFDLPSVAARVKDVPAHGGDFVSGPLPTGFDLVTLIRIVHDHDDPVIVQLLRNIAGSLPPGGTLLIAEPLAQTPGAEAVGDGYFGFYLWAMGSGRPRSVATIESMLTSNGFESVREWSSPTPMLARVITARRSRA